MKLSTAILMATLTTAGTAWAQSPNVLQDVRDKMNSVQQQKQAASDAALGGTQAKAAVAKPAAGSAAKSAATPAPKPASASASAKPAAPAAAKAAPTQAAPAKTAAAKPASAPAPAKAVAPVVAAKAPAKNDASKKNAPKKDVAKKDAPKADAAKSVAKADSKDDTKKTDQADAANAEKADDKKEERYITAGNRRDPFVSPIVQHLSSTGCSTGKRCLAIDQIALRGVVKSDGGMIAVVVNGLDKAYFLRENDPVFNGYVVKISGDSIVFKETVQDKLGHLSTREVVKKITTPAV
jgi:Tfp pilus assembly protein PilP